MDPKYKKPKEKNTRTSHNQLVNTSDKEKNLKTTI